MAKLLVIDPQVDFCSPDGALSVPGAAEDMQRLAAMVDEMGAEINQIYVTLDSHNPVHIAHPLCWEDSDGNHPAPFTSVSYEDVQSGKWVHSDPGKRAYALGYLGQLKEQTRGYPMTIWPPHCLIGTSGHNVYPELAAALHRWEALTGTPVKYVVKGNNPLTEHYSALRADVPTEDPTTEMLEWLVKELEAADTVLIAGEASSHCVNYTVRDLMEEFAQENLPKLVLLKDAMSPVTGFESAAAELFHDAETSGVGVCEISGLGRILKASEKIRC